MSSPTKLCSRKNTNLFGIEICIYFKYYNMSLRIGKNPFA